MSDDPKTWTPERALGEVMEECGAITSECDGGIVAGKLSKLGVKVLPPLPDWIRRYDLRVSDTGYAELDVMQALAALFQGLDPDEQRRVLDWAEDRYRIEATS